MGLRTLPATTTARHSINARKPRWLVLWGSFTCGYGWGSLGIDTQSISDRCRGTNAGKGVDTTEEYLAALCSSYILLLGVPSSSLLIPSNNHILPRLESRGAGLSKG